MAKEKALRDIEAAEKALADTKQAAISKLAEKVGDDSSAKAANILDEARRLINKADSVEKVNDLLEQYSEKLEH